MKHSASTPGPGSGNTAAPAGSSHVVKRPLEDKKSAVASAARHPDVEEGAQDAENGGAHDGVGTAGEEEPIVQPPIPVSVGETGITLTFSNFSAPEAFTFVAKKQPGSRPDEGAIPKTKLAVRRLAAHNAPGVKEEGLEVERLRSATRRAQEKGQRRLLVRGLSETEDDVEELNPMREVFRDPADVVAKVHYPWALWDLAALQEKCPSPEKNINKFTEYFLTAVRAQEANWVDTKILLQKLLPPAKYRDLMALWDWGDDMLAVPTYPKRVDGTGNISAGTAGDAARTTALIADIKSLYPVKPPLQCLESCTFSKDDTAYTFMDKTREAFTQIMGPGAADNESFRPFILSHYVNYLPSTVSHKIKATVGWESFSFATVCAHAAHHLKDLGEVKKEKKERLLALQLLNLENAPAGNFQQVAQNIQVPQVHPQQGSGGHQGVGSGSRGGGRRRRGARGGGAHENAQHPKPCARCGAFGHYAKFCTAVMVAPGQITMAGQSLQGLPAQGQLAIGPPPNAQGALNVYAPPFFQTSNAQNQQTFATPGHQQSGQQFRTA